jgi:hypothetical protein
MSSILPDQASLGAMNAYEKFCLQGFFPLGHGKIALDTAPATPDRQPAAGLAGLALSLHPG